MQNSMPTRQGLDSRVEIADKPRPVQQQQWGQQEGGELGWWEERLWQLLAPGVNKSPELLSRAKYNVYHIHTSTQIVKT